MPSPDINFLSEEAELKYGVKTLLEAGFTAKQIDRIRHEIGVGVDKTPYSKELTGQRRHMTSELLAANMSNSQIARVLKLSKETVNADRKHIRQLYTEEILKSADVHRARLLKEQMDLKDVAMKSFEGSKKKRTITTNDNGEEDSSSMIKIEESAGDASFLNVAKNCLVEQAKLLGLNELRPQQEEKKDYKSFLDDLAKTVGDIKEREANSTAIDTTVADDDASTAIVSLS
jgi:IS30 family transposase